MQRLIKCSSSRVQIKDSGLNYGVDDEADHHFLLSKCRVGCTMKAFRGQNIEFAYIYVMLHT